MNVNKRVSAYMRWFLATLNPHLDAPQILPSESDWWNILMSPAGASAIKNMESHVFNMNATPLPTDENKLSKHDDDQFNLSDLTWKPAGLDALQRSAAATAYLVRDVQSNFKNVGNAWAGALSSFLFCNKSHTHS